MTVSTNTVVSNAAPVVEVAHFTRKDGTEGKKVYCLASEHDLIVSISTAIGAAGVDYIGEDTVGNYHQMGGIPYYFNIDENSGFVALANISQGEYGGKIITAAPKYWTAARDVSQGFRWLMDQMATRYITATGGAYNEAQFESHKLFWMTSDAAMYPRISDALTARVAMKAARLDQTKQFKIVTDTGYQSSAVFALNATGQPKMIKTGSTQVNGAWVNPKPLLLGYVPQTTFDAIAAIPEYQHVCWLLQPTLFLALTALNDEQLDHVVTAATTAKPVFNPQVAFTTTERVQSEATTMRIHPLHLIAGWGIRNDNAMSTLLDKAVAQAKLEQNRQIAEATAKKQAKAAAASSSTTILTAPSMSDNPF